MGMIGAPPWRANQLCRHPGLFEIHLSTLSLCMQSSLGRFLDYVADRDRGRGRSPRLRLWHCSCQWWQ